MLIKFFSNPVFDYVGKRSLGIYLWQLPVFALAEAKLLEPFAWYNILWQLALIVGLAELSYRFVEIPAQKFDYSNIMEIVHRFVTGGEWKTRRKLIQSGLVLIFVAILGLIVFSPASPRDQEILQQKILAQQEVLFKEQQKVANAKVSLPLKTVASKYSVQPIVAEKASKMKIIAVGDSVMIAASTNLKEMFPSMSINATVGEQVSSGAKYLQDHADDVKNADAILVALGTNGLLTYGGTDYINKILSLSQGKPIYWVNIQAPNKPWMSVNNKQLTQAAKSNKDLTIIDWNKASTNNPSWFYSDLIHPQGEGAIEYTTLVAKSMTHQF
uniref:acyltransferase family protein n=1 Tax=Lactococcus fujiensis TaxID=610251 RepID=UPI000AAAA545|nr:hypothetical protein [Lactococcus fujiensis]